MLHYICRLAKLKYGVYTAHRKRLCTFSAASVDICILRNILKCNFAQGCWLIYFTMSTGTNIVYIIMIVHILNIEMLLINCLCVQSKLCYFTFQSGSCTYASFPKFRCEATIKNPNKLKAWRVKIYLFLSRSIYHYTIRKTWLQHL